MLANNSMTADYKISCHKKDIDFDKVFNFISQSYWAKGIPRSVFDKAIDNSMCFSVLKVTLSGESQLVGFARMITDKATFAYLADVYIEEIERGKGLSKMLLDDIMSHEDLKGLRRIMLATKDAHGLYESFGFSKIMDIDIFMQVWNPDVYTLRKD